MSADFRLWHETDMPTALGNVRCQEQSGKHMLALSFSGFDPRRVKTFFFPQKLYATGRDPGRRDRLSIFLLYRVLESIRAQHRATLSDLNGHTARTTIRAPHARIAARSGLIPRMFITRVRL